jgi:hypothetical protein
MLSVSSPVHTLAWMLISIVGSLSINEVDGLNGLAVQPILAAY